MKLGFLKRRPFRLNPAALAWVRATFAGLSTEAKLAQLVVPLALDLSRENLDRYLELGVGGIFRLGRQPFAALRQQANFLQGHSALPMLLSADIEFTEGAIIGDGEGTWFPNQMAIAATADVRWAARMAEVAAREGRFAGFNWSFSPVVDLNLDFRNPLVSTRSFGDSHARVLAYARAYVQALQAGGVAACAKHWPGDGADDRDQHFVTSVNRLSLPAWRASFGRVYRGLIDAGVLSVMSAHIALPAFPGAGRTPASISRALNLELLRGQLGFNGVIVSDASLMAGLTDVGPREELVPRIIEHGCDVLLFPADLELDLDYLRRALATGRLTCERVDEAVLRVLALKAALGLHRSTKLPHPRFRSRGVTRGHDAWAANCAAKAVTLVRDQDGLLPISPRKHRRVLLVEEAARENFYGTLPPLEFGRLLSAAGFAVENFSAETVVSPDHFDLLIYAVGLGPMNCRSSLALPWVKLHGSLVRSLERYWHTLPTIFVSFGSPFHVREVPSCPVYINAYSPAPAAQRAALAALTGEIPFRGVSPVDLGRALTG